MGRYQIIYADPPWQFMNKIQRKEDFYGRRLSGKTDL